MPDTDLRPWRHAGVSTGVLPRVPRFATAWAVTLTVLVGLVFTGTTALTIALWATDPAYTQTSPVVDLAFFALGGILITVGFASQIRARQVAGLQQALLALLALAVTGLLAGRIEPFVGALLLLVAAAPMAVLHPACRQLLAAGETVSRPLAALGIAAVIPAVAYAAAMLDRARSAGPSCFLGQCAEGDRFAETAALAVARGAGGAAGVPADPGVEAASMVRRQRRDRPRRGEPGLSAGAWSAGCAVGGGCRGLGRRLHGRRVHTARWASGAGAPSARNRQGR